MTVKVFLTGATGYIGGDALHVMHEAYPDYEYTLLVRSEDGAKPVAEKYPKAKFVYGSHDDATVIEKAAAAADVVVHTAYSSDHTPAASAIIKGLAEGHSAEKPGYWLHISGTSLLTWYDIQQGRFGEAPLPEQTYNDLEDVERLVSLPDVAPHRDVEQLLQDARSPAVRIAIVCPPTIYGKGRGAVNQISKQIPGLVKRTLEKGFAPIAGAGKTEWDNVHVHDLSDLLLKLLEATQDPSRQGDAELFGRHGYFLAENGHHVWSDVARCVAEEAKKQGYIAEAIAKPVPDDELKGSTWGLNSKGEARRARKLLGWTPRGVPYQETIAELVPDQAKILGISPRGQQA